MPKECFGPELGPKSVLVQSWARQLFAQAFECKFQRFPVNKMEFNMSVKTKCSISVLLTNQKYLNTKLVPCSDLLFQRDYFSLQE